MRRLYIIKDETGNAGTYSITIQPSGSETIDGAATKVINTAYGSVRLYSNGANWFTWWYKSLIIPGNVGIGTTAPTEKLEVSGNIKASGTVSQGSSKEFKKNIAYISTKEAMKTLNGLNPVRFEYKSDESGEKHLGFIAEDVPELVAEQDRKHLNAMDITAVLTKVVQEQQRIISALKAEMEEIKGRL